MKKVVTIYLDVQDEEILESIEREPRKFQRRLQNALDHEYPYARMESLRVHYVGVGPVPSPSSSETDG